ncbi:NADH dehydrogenase [ubiquinone] 1 alpha subcomplex subunit 6 [Plasmodiophora brassicae]|uniref:NADH dehydrogenase [ubiquinone] 1 alpha subcomplex subunit 6 n=1 Tax=Plasmodiophora brassicae TaxID=37360 RepID=A0A0G4J907_PLABS|nr:hypothetical protein PBRA_003526 [Plasmodiophora brassicae]SPQ99880.1 unnamed protein product [Plasmodiophora brassicae]
MNPRSLPPVSTFASAGAHEARQRVLHLYRRVVRAMPGILNGYDISDMSTPQAVKNVGTRFRRFRDVDDINMIDMLRCKAEMELHETLLGFKTRSHVLKALEPWRDTKIAVPASLVQSSRHVSPFLQKFYYGEAVTPKEP